MPRSALGRRRAKGEARGETARARPPRVSRTGLPARAGVPRTDTRRLAWPPAEDVSGGFLGGLIPFGGLAIPEGPMALRPTLADGLPLSRNPVASALPGRAAAGRPGGRPRTDTRRVWPDRRT